MKRWMLGAMVAGLTFALVPIDVEAKRLGGARSSGVQRTAPDKPVQKAPAQEAGTPAQTPGAAAAPAAAAAPTAAAAATQQARRSWTGPLMGLAAGLGLAALFSHLGWGEGLSSVMMMLLMGLLAFAAFRFFMSRRRAATPDGASLAGAGGGVMPSMPAATQRSSVVPNAGGDVRIGTALQPPLAVPGLNDAAPSDSARYLPADFDTVAFERLARTIFIRLQAANDERNLNELRAFTTPQMFAELQTDILERGDAPQHTEVMSVNPSIVDFEDTDGQLVVSVRYVGVIREAEGAPSTSFDEVWHLVKAADSPAWRIAGIQQRD